MDEFKCLTLKSNGNHLSAIKTHCNIFNSDRNTNQINAQNTYQAIWDTGATNTVVTSKVTTECDLPHIDFCEVHGVSGIVRTKVYLAAIILPNSVGIYPVRVTEGNLPGGDNGDVLIGMDIINLGDFSITNFNNKTVFSFRVPSRCHVDFVQQHLEHSKMRKPSKKRK